MNRSLVFGGVAAVVVCAIAGVFLLRLTPQLYGHEFELEYRSQKWSPIFEQPCKVVD